MKTTIYIVQLVESIPERARMREGVIYVSDKFRIINYLCPCGCGLETPLPFGPEETVLGGGPQWQLMWDEPDKILTIAPSILVDGGCRSHYHIKRNTVQ